MESARDRVAAPDRAGGHRRPSGRVPAGVAGLADGGRSHVSSGELASAAGVNPAGLRKDLSYLGSYGVRGVGYEVVGLRARRIRGARRGTRTGRCVLVGIGQLGPALADYTGFASRGFQFAGAARHRPAHGRHRGRRPARPPDGRARRGGRRARPGHDRRDRDTGRGGPGVCDRLVAAGVTSILNFAPVVLTVPAGVDVRKVDLSVELQMLAFLDQQPAAAAVGAMRATGGVQ